MGWAEKLRDIFGGRDTLGLSARQLLWVEVGRTGMEQRESCFRSASSSSSAPSKSPLSASPRTESTRCGTFGPCLEKGWVSVVIYNTKMCMKYIYVDPLGTCLAWAIAATFICGFGIVGLMRLRTTKSASINGPRIATIYTSLALVATIFSLSFSIWMWTRQGGQRDSGNSWHSQK